jgi:hypothetical protein
MTSRKYAKYAPAGATIKELSITVSEQGYLEILHGLNLAKLKLQDSVFEYKTNIVFHYHLIRQSVI